MGQTILLSLVFFSIIYVLIMHIYFSVMIIKIERIKDYRLSVENICLYLFSPIIYLAKYDKSKKQIIITIINFLLLVFITVTIVYYAR